MSNKYKLEATMSVDLDEVKKFVESDRFTNFLLSNTTDFTVAGYILQTLLDSLERDAKEYGYKSIND